MLEHRLSALLLSVLMLSTGVVAAQVDNVIRPIRGTIDSVNDHSVIITTRQGEKLDVVLTDKTK